MCGYKLEYSWKHLKIWKIYIIMLYIDYIFSNVFYVKTDFIYVRYKWLYVYCFTSFYESAYKITQREKKKIIYKKITHLYKEIIEVQQKDNISLSLS